MLKRSKTIAHVQADTHNPKVQETDRETVKVCAGELCTLQGPRLISACVCGHTSLKPRQHTPGTVYARITSEQEIHKMLADSVAALVLKLVTD